MLIASWLVKSETTRALTRISTNTNEFSASSWLRKELGRWWE